ncbi:MAG: hypothetical protein AAF394_00690 [Planctomycetota bacterium]
MSNAPQDREHVQTRLRRIWTERERVERRLLAQQKQRWLLEKIGIGNPSPTARVDTSMWAKSLFTAKQN